MADLTLTLTGNHYYNSKYGIKTGSNSGTGSSATAATNAAANAAASAASSALEGLHCNPTSGGSTDNSSLIIGSSNVSYTTVGRDNSPRYDSRTSLYIATSSWSAERTINMHQVKFTYDKTRIPSYITKDTISSATLKITGTHNTTSSRTYYIMAPVGTTQQSEYKRYSENNLINKEISASFTANSTSSTTFSINIKSVFQKCIELGANWIFLGLDLDFLEATRLFTITSATIEVNYTYTKVGTPTNVKVNNAVSGVILAPGGTATITWTAPNNGINNPVVGYKIYYTAAASSTAPTTSSTAINQSTSMAASCSFTVPSNAVRAYYYTFKVQAIGQISGFDGDLSSASANFRVNSLPQAPNISLATNRIKANESTVVVTCTPGTDTDTSQTKEVYYSNTNSTSNVTKVNNNTVSLGVGTYYFWTKDGLEFSNSSTPKVITKNVVPSVTLGTLSVSGALATMSKATITSSTGTIQSKQWYIKKSGGSWVAMSGKTGDSFSQYDITSDLKSALGWNTQYAFKLVATDDIGDTGSAETSLSNTYKTPVQPTISETYNQADSDSNKSGTTISHFRDWVRIKYGSDKSGMTRKLIVNNVSNISLTNIDSTHDKVNLSSYVDYSNTATCSIVCSFGANLSTTINFPRTYQRTANISPTGIGVATNGDGNIYEATLMTLTFNGLYSLGIGNDMPETSETPQSKYTLELFKKNTSSAVVTLVGSDTGVTNSLTVSEGLTTWIVNLSDISKANWKTLTGSTTMPMGSYDIDITIKVTNNFEEVFTGTKRVTIFFAEKDISTTCMLKIKTTDDVFVPIPIANNSYYPIFQSQIVRFSIASFDCNTNFPVTIKITDNRNTISQNYTVTPNNSYQVTEQNFDITIPAINSTQIVTFTIAISSGSGTGIKTQTITNKICKYIRTQVDSVDLSITGVNKPNEDEDTYNVTYSVGDYGGSGNTVPYVAEYDNIGIKIYYSTSSNGTYTQIGSQQPLNKASTTGTVSVSWPEHSDPEVLPANFYVGYSVVVVNNFQLITYNEETYTPYGTDTYETTLRKNTFIFYGETPTILYGKNFLGINTELPKSGSATNSEGILTIKPYDNHTIIYIGYTDAEGTFEITQNGLVIDCGTW